jgi:hypothetical protein
MPGAYTLNQVFQYLQKNTVDLSELMHVKNMNGHLSCFFFKMR